MKKIVVICLIALFLFQLCSCGTKSTEQEEAQLELENRIEQLKEENKQLVEENRTKDETIDDLQKTKEQLENSILQLEQELEQEKEKASENITTPSKTYLAFEDACGLYVDTLDYESALGISFYSFNGISIDNKIIKENQTSSMLKGKPLSQGVLYDSLAESISDYLETYPNGYEPAFGISFWDAYGDICTVLWDAQKTNDDSGLKERFQDISQLFVNESEINPLIGIMSRFSECKTIIGTFASETQLVNGAEYTFEIPDLTKTAEELGITETALGYVLAKVSEYTQDFTFSGNSYKCDMTVSVFSSVFDSD